MPAIRLHLYPSGIAQRIVDVVGRIITAHPFQGVVLANVLLTDIRGDSCCVHILIVCQMKFLDID